jgi:thioredoxin-related protein
MPLSRGAPVYRHPLSFLPEVLSAYSWSVLWLRLARPTPIDPEEFTMSKACVTLMLLLSLFGSPVFAKQPARADQIFENAKAEAAQQHKLIFLVFGASWCGPCHRLDAFLTSPETRPIVQKYFVLAKLNVDEKKGKHPELETPGAENMLAKLGGANAGVPFIVFLDATGSPIVDSRPLVDGRPEGENIGYPAQPKEVDWFMAMLKKAVPSMTADESRTIERWLRGASPA